MWLMVKHDTKKTMENTSVRFLEKPAIRTCVIIRLFHSLQEILLYLLSQLTVVVFCMKLIVILLR